MVRLIVVVIALFLGHDALMAANPHGDTSKHTGHHEAATLVCESIDDARVQGSLLPMPYVPVAFISTVIAGPVLAENMQIGDQIVAIADASSLRAMLQVFLN